MLIFQLSETLTVLQNATELQWHVQAAQLLSWVMKTKQTKNCMFVQLLYIVKLQRSLPMAGSVIKSQDWVVGTQAQQHQDEAQVRLHQLKRADCTAA